MLFSLLDLIYLNRPSVLSSDEQLWKRPWCWERLKAEGEEGDRGWDGWMASLIQWTWTPEDGDGQGGLVCCSPWGRKELNMTEWLNWTSSPHIPAIRILVMPSALWGNAGSSLHLKVVNCVCKIPLPCEAAFPGPGDLDTSGSHCSASHTEKSGQRDSVTFQRETSII